MVNRETTWNRERINDNTSPVRIFLDSMNWLFVYMQYRQASEVLPLHRFVEETSLVLNKAASENNADEFFGRKTTIDQLVTALRELQIQATSTPVSFEAFRLDVEGPKAAINALTLLNDNSPIPGMLLNEDSIAYVHSSKRSFQWCSCPISA